MLDISLELFLFLFRVYFLLFQKSLLGRLGSRQVSEASTIFLSMMASFILYV